MVLLLIEFRFPRCRGALFSHFRVMYVTSSPVFGYHGLEGGPSLVAAPVEFDSFARGS